ncbi:MAG: AAA family ATPase [Alphaproteobacteria bacterium]
MKPAPYEHLYRAVRLALGEDDPAGRPQAQRLGKVVAVCGARGGAGATTLLANVGWVLANKQSRRVVMVDLDLQNGSLHLALDFPANHGLREALENAHRLDPLFLERTMLQHGQRLFALAAEEPLEEDIVYSPDAVKELTQILQKQFHYVFVDVPRSTPGALEIVRRADIRLLVAEPSIASVRDIVRRLEAIKVDNSARRNYIALNHPRQDSKGELTVEQFEEGIGQKVDFIIPYGRSTAAESLNFGEPMAARKCPASAAFAGISGELIGDRPRTVVDSSSKRLRYSSAFSAWSSRPGGELSGEVAGK